MILTGAWTKGTSIMVAKRKPAKHFHRMPDGTMMEGKAHGVKKTPVKKRTPKK
jgi:hypothetical protein